MLGIQRRPERGLYYVNLYHMLIVGKREPVNEAIPVLQQSFEVKPPTTLEDYMGVQVIKSKNGEKAWLGQPTIIKSLEKMFDEDVKTL